MTILYNCKHDGDQYRITKFDDGEPQGSYLLSLSECECPAGHRPMCRHREMLPLFLARDAIGTGWWYDYDRGGWVDMGHLSPGHTDLMISPEAIDNAPAQLPPRTYRR